MSATALRVLSRISAAVFGTVLNPTNQRNGLKELRKNLVGPAIVNYYPASASMWARFDKEYQDEDTEYAVSKAARLRRRGKGPPKKGTRPVLHNREQRAHTVLNRPTRTSGGTGRVHRRGQARDPQEEKIDGDCSPFLGGVSSPLARPCTAAHKERKENAGQWVGGCIHATLPRPGVYRYVSTWTPLQRVWWSSCLCLLSGSVCTWPSRP